MENFFVKFKNYITTFALIGATLLVGLVDYTFYDIEVELNGGRLPSNTTVNTFFTPQEYLNHEPTRNGYVFLGWYVNNTTPLESYNHFSREDITLVARWQALQARITFVTNGGNSINAINANIDTNITLPTPTRSGYAFVGWRTTSSTSGVLYQAGSSYRVANANPITFYAFWDQIRSVTVTFDANGGTVTPTSRTGNSGTALTLPTPTRAGFVFDGWFTNANLSESTRFVGTVFPSSNITLYAKWTVVLNTGVSFDTAINMVVNTNYTVNITSGGQFVYYRFVPTQSGTYVFSSSGNNDPIGALYSASQSLLVEDDDSGVGSNFRFSRSLTVNTTYYLRVRLFSTRTGSFTISVTR